MVLAVGATTGAIAAFPPLVAIVGSTGAGAAGAVTIPTLAAAEAVAVATAAGAGAGAVTTAAGTAAATSVLAVGEGAAVGIGTLFGGSSAAGITAATALGPFGWAVLGCEENDDCFGNSNYTWDCWKPVVRDFSTKPSSGMPLRTLATHPNIRSMALDEAGILVGNIFGEHFHLTPVIVEGALAFHASALI